MTEVIDKPKTPPANTLTVFNWDDLPKNEELAAFRILDGDKVKTIRVSRKARRLLEGLMMQPVKVASPCRLSHYADVLRDDYGLNIETIRYPSKIKGNSPYGVYFLRSKVERGGGELWAA